MVTRNITGILRGRKLITRCACLCVVMGLCRFSLFALDPQRDIHQFAHRSWLEKDGYPGQPRAMAQTTDGFLWIGANDGLYRFDGVRFERYLSGSGDKLQGGAVLSLLAAPDGSLWIGFAREGRISVLRNGKVMNYARAVGLPVDTTVLSIAEGHDGTMWANTGTGLIRLEGTKWERVDNQWNVPREIQHTGSTVLFVDSHGTLWAGVGNTVMYLKQGSKRFEPTGIYAGQAMSMAEAPDGKIWMADDTSATRVISMPVSAASTARAQCEVRALRSTDQCPSDSQFEIRTDAMEVLFDRNGGLWVTAMTHGVLRLPDSLRLKSEPVKEVEGEVQSFTSKDGLSADNCTSILEDREGNIWVATRDGLDQFRDTKLAPVIFPTSTMEIGLAPADEGDVWASANFGSVARIDGYSMKLALIDAEVYSVYRDPAGVTWLLGGSGLQRWESGRFQRVASAPEGLSGIGGDMQIVSDGSGTLWAFVKGLGFLSLDRHQWKGLSTPPEVAKLWPAIAFCDNTGRIWISTYSGDIVAMDHGKIMTYPPKTNGRVKFVSAFAQRGSGVWITSEDGLLLFDNGRFTLIKPAGVDHFGFVPGIVDSGSEGVWFIAVDGVVHIPSHEIDKSLKDPSYRFQWERFDSTDGLPGKGKHSEPYPQVIQGTDGRIWFIATKGVAWIDPRKISRNTIPPPVSITSVSADGSPRLQLADLRLPARTANLKINYSVLSLSVQEKDQIRYKLDGIDKDWQDPGTRREALYSRLPPGHYQFHVIASNNDGVWNKVGANLSFVIAPAWFQTIWFEILIAVGVLALVWMVYTLRLRQVTAHIQEGLGTRLEERERIARELHDTLLQSFQGLTLQFQRARNLLPDRAAEAIHTLDEALDGAEEAIIEGRDAIHDLRSSAPATKGLAEEITAFGEELVEKSTADKEPVQFRIVVEGSAHLLRPNAHLDVFRIAREGMRNAFGHSQGRLIETELAYTESLFRLRIRDDGKGIDPEARLHAERTGHWGLKGMRERAGRLGGELEVWSEPGAGTEIELRVPASIAYEAVLPQSGFWQFWRRKGNP